MRCSASGMFASDNVNSCTCVIRKSIYSLCIVRRLSVTDGFRYCILCSFDLVRQSPVFSFLLFNYMDTLYMYVYIV